MRSVIPGKNELRAPPSGRDQVVGRQGVPRRQWHRPPRELEREARQVRALVQINQGGAQLGQLVSVGLDPLHLRSWERAKQRHGLLRYDRTHRPQERRPEVQSWGLVVDPESLHQGLFREPIFAE